mgnify:CR=1 FL=1
MPGCRTTLCPPGVRSAVVCDEGIFLIRPFPASRYDYTTINHFWEDVFPKLSVCVFVDIDMQIW